MKTEFQPNSMILPIAPPTNSSFPLFLSLFPFNLFPVFLVITFPEFVVVHNGIITNYKDIKKFLVSCPTLFMESITVSALSLYTL